MVAKLEDPIGATPDGLPDDVWRNVVELLKPIVEPGDILLAPNEFIHFFPGTIALHVVRAMIPGISIEYFVLHKGMLDFVDVELLDEAVSLTPLYADDVFALYGRRGQGLPPEQARHLESVRDHLARQDRAVDSGIVAAVVPTCGRVWALRRSLQSLTKQCRHIVVVDDASPPLHRIRNRWTAMASGAHHIHLPGDLGKAAALNVGIDFWLARPEVQWISTFDDGIELAEGALETLQRVAAAAPYAADAVTYSGYQSPHHSERGTATIAGHSVVLARSCSGQHIHAHRSLWQNVLPIPTAYPGAPKSHGGAFPGQGCDTDWCVSSWSPNSAVKRGGDIVIIPGLVSTFGVGRSTWGGPGD